MHRPNCLLSGQRVHPIVMPHLKVQKWIWFLLMHKNHNKHCLWLFELSKKIWLRMMILVSLWTAHELTRIFEKICQVNRTLCQRDGCNAPWLGHRLGHEDRLKLPTERCRKLSRKASPSGHGNFALRVLQEDHGHHRGSQQIDFTWIIHQISAEIVTIMIHELNWGRESWKFWLSDFLGCWLEWGLWMRVRTVVLIYPAIMGIGFIVALACRSQSRPGCKWLESSYAGHDGCDKHVYKQRFAVKTIRQLDCILIKRPLPHKTFAIWGLF